MASGNSLASQSNSNKLALLIGNNAYQKGEQLRCCINDAQDLGDKLRTIGFQVTTGYDLNYERMDTMIYDFANNVKSRDLVVFFFSGHGTQWNDQNYLLPTDDNRLNYAKDCKYKAINAQDTLQKIMDSKPAAAIFLLDCCRAYLFPNEAATKGSKRSTGLSTMQGVAGSIIAFACEAGKTALDGSKNGRNGIFTAHLLEHIAQPNVTIDEVMYHICDGVMTESQDGQCPFRVSSLRKKVYLNLHAHTNNEVPMKEQIHSSEPIRTSKIKHLII